MSDTIQISETEHEYCTAKEAMQFAVQYMQSRTVHAVQNITCRHGIAPDSEAELFIKMFGRFLHKNRCKVFLLAENEKVLARMIELLPDRYMGIQIVSMATIVETGSSEEMILNRINGDEVDCIIAALPDEMQQAVFQQYRTLLDVKIWVELGTKLRGRKRLTDLWKKFFRQKKAKYRKRNEKKGK